MKDRAAWVEGIIRDCVRNSADNCLKDAGGEKSWDDVLVGFSRGDDPLYAFFKADIGAFYWLPAEAFAFAYPDAEVLPDELTVISWVLPQRDVTKADNRKQKQLPAERWIRSRVLGEAFNVRLAGHLVAALKTADIDAVVPSQLPQWSPQTSAKYSFASTWSERHTAYAAGLGTFGLSDGLITPRGKAMRCGSVIARVSIPPTPRPYREPYAYCLHFTQKKCGKCIGRCPAGAIDENGHDKAKCRDYLHYTVSPYAEAHFGLQSYGCGLCQTAVPCESTIPRVRDTE
jgi:epoxyqueuosine reductase